MDKTYFFLVILGETDKQKNLLQLERLRKLGEVHNILNNIYGLLIKSSVTPKYTDIRDTVSGDDKFLTIVIRLTTNTKCGWCIEKTNSEYLTDVFKIMYSELNDER